MTLTDIINDMKKMDELEIKPLGYVPKFNFKINYKKNIQKETPMFVTGYKAKLAEISAFFKRKWVITKDFFREKYYNMFPKVEIYI